MDRLPRLTRRDWLRLAAAGAVGCSSSGWIESLAADTSTDPRRRRACILLWMTGGPSQTDTFDPKPGHAHGGPLKVINTSVPGIVISEHLPKLAQRMKDIAIIRAMSTKEGDHGRATFNLRTGYTQQGPIHYPTLGALVAKELESGDSELPSFVSIAPYRGFNPAAFGPGFLGPRYAPLVVGERATFDPQGVGDARTFGMQVENLHPPAGIAAARTERAARHPRRHDERLRGKSSGHRAAEPPGCLPARRPADAFGRRARLRARRGAGRGARQLRPHGVRPGLPAGAPLVERGVPFVEVTLSSISGSSGFAWDTHAQNFESVKSLCGVLDPAWSALMDDLRGRGLLDSTLIVWMGEFGRTPKINPNAGRDHFPAAWTTVLAGGGIKGGQVIGDTGPSGMSVKDRPVSVPDFLATVCRSVGIDPMTQNLSDVGRPIRIVDPKAKPIQEIIASATPSLKGGA